MTGNSLKKTDNNVFFTPLTYLLVIIMAVGYSSSLIRFIFGLGSFTNLTDASPWGIWIAVDVAGGVALAAGGFTTAALINIFGKKEFKSLERGAILTSWLGYIFVGAGLMFDIGRYYNIWHPAVYWQGNSVLFEVGVCVMLYLTVLTIEVSPVILSKIAYHNGWLAKRASFLKDIVHKVMPAIIIAGVVLSFMHQSSLGTLLVIAPTKIDPLWWSPFLPVHFLLSAIMVGFPVVIVESLFASRTFNTKYKIELLSKLAKFIPLFIGVAFLVRVTDFLYRGGYNLLSGNLKTSILFSLELTGGMIIPFIMFLFARVRSNIKLLLLGSFLVISGVLLNRINVFITAYNPLLSSESYTPSILEVTVTGALIATIIFLFKLFAWFFGVVEQNNDAIKRKNIFNKRAIFFLLIIIILSFSVTATYIIKRITKESHSLIMRKSVKKNFKESKLKIIHKTLITNAQGTLILPVPHEFVLDNSKINNKSDFYGSVIFSHHGHASFVDGDCTVCHHRQSSKAGDKTGHSITFDDLENMRIESCNNCHDFKRDQIDKIHPDLKTDCGACHHHDDPDFDPEDLQKIKLTKCSTCHTDDIDFKYPQKPGLKGALHTRCINCHKEESHKKKKSSAPVGCNGCHRKKSSKEIAGYKRFTCVNCHSKKPHELFSLYGHHLDEHVQHLECTDCHKPDQHRSSTDFASKQMQHKAEINIKNAKKCSTCHTKEEIKCQNCHDKMPAITIINN